MEHDGVYFSKDHAWVRIEGDKAYIGITGYAEHSLGTIVFVELPSPGTELFAGRSFGIVESFKAASELSCPVGGKVTNINQAVIADPSLINQNPRDTWLVCMHYSDQREIALLMDEEEYQKSGK